VRCKLYKNLPLYVSDKWQGKEHELRAVGVRSLRKTIRTYTMVMAMVFHGMNPMKITSSPLPDVKNPSRNSTTTQECQPSNVFYTATWEGHYFKGTFFIDQLHYLSQTTKTKNWNQVSVRSNSKHFDSTEVAGSFKLVNMSLIMPCLGVSISIYWSRKTLFLPHD